MSNSYDVAIVGGGPAGSTLGSLLRKYDPSKKVVILEREKFPRDHVGESQLPPISHILDEMGCWDKVEAANFPIKIGATYRWGKSKDLWDFEFLPGAMFNDQERPAKFEGQRRHTAFQVDRATYDKILLDHAAELGCEVREETRVTEVLKEGDRILGFKLSDGSVVEANHYVDASGSAGIMRRSMGVEADEPAQLRNIAIWDYWENAEWAVKIGVGGTRVNVMSLGYGWLWFIPLGPTRTSIGLIVPADHYKSLGKSPEQLYLDAIAEEPLISQLVSNAKREMNLQATKDWSFVCERMAGENWFLVGECAGFADPILAAGMTLAQSGARELAFSILEIDRGKHEAQWVKDQYQTRQQKRISQHIRFANYWYTANGIFTDLQAYTAEIAKDEGFVLDAKKAWQWFGTGAFITEEDDFATYGGFTLDQVKVMHGLMTEHWPEWELSKHNEFKLNLGGAMKKTSATYSGGEIKPVACYIRNNQALPLTGYFALLVHVLNQERDADKIMRMLMPLLQKAGMGRNLNDAVHKAMQSLEGMLLDGWVVGSFNKKRPPFQLATYRETNVIHANRDIAVPV
ncbi:MAG: NAD(P)/FAD-dependent oxidoreductase [Fimbriimonas sp.]